jgi:peptide/nickel transport system substrate-binding protein
MEAHYMKRNSVLFAVLLALALVAAACSSSSDDTTTTTAAPAATTTTQGGSDATTTTAAADPSFAGKAVAQEGGCEAAGYNGRVDSITAVDEFTVEFKLCSPTSSFLAQIAFGVFGIQPEEHLEATGGAPLDNPIGTGPYALQEWIRGDSVVYTRNDAYYGQVAPHQTAVLQWATESAGRMIELQGGEAYGMTFPGPEDYATFEADPNLVLLNKPEANIFYAGMTNTFPPFDNVDVRKAIGMGIDRQRIVDIFYPPGSEVASHFTPCSVEFGCEGESWYDFDVEGAKALLEGAGLGDGFETEIFYRDVTRGYLPTPGNVAADIQDQLKVNLNIDATVTVLESGDFIEKCSNTGTCDGIHLLGWTGDYPHVSNFLEPHFAETVDQFGTPYPEVYEPTVAASASADPAVQGPLYGEANTALKELVPMVPIAHSGAAFGATADVEGAYAPPWGQVLFNFWDNKTDTMVFVQGNEPISLYCADETDGESLRACAQVVEALYGYDQAGAVIPQLATECVSNEDATLWTCSLRQGVVFHDGTTFDANDVIVSYAAGLDASSPLHTGNTGSWVYYEALWNGLVNAPAG